MKGIHEWFCSVNKYWVSTQFVFGKKENKKSKQYLRDILYECEYFYFFGGTVFYSRIMFYTFFKFLS